MSKQVILDDKELTYLIELIDESFSNYRNSTNDDDIEFQVEVIFNKDLLAKLKD